MVKEENKVKDNLFTEDGALDIAKLGSVLCKCGHSILTHYFAEGCCDRSACGCPKFEQVRKEEI